MKNFWKRYKKWIILAIVLLLLVWMFWPRQAKTEYTTEKAKLAKVEQVVSVTGTVEADTKVELHFQKTGKVTHIPVEVGDAVEANQVLASLDTKTLQIQVDQAQAGVAIAQANLNLRLAGPSQQDINVTQKDVDTALVAYNAALTNLETTRRSAIESQKKAELGVSNAQVAVTNAQKQYDNAVASGSTNTTKSSQDVTNAYEVAKNTVASALINATSALPVADNILGVDKRDVNDSFEIYLGILNLQSKVNAENSYLTAKTALNDLQTQYNNLIAKGWKGDDVDKFLPTAQTDLSTINQMLKNVYDVLTYTTSSSAFPQTTIDADKTTISTLQTSISTNITSVQTAIQTISNAKLGISSTQTSNDSAVTNAAASLDTAKNNLESAKRTLEQTKADNDKIIVSSQADADLKSVAYQRAKASYELKVAVPRTVDLAALRAQVQQAQSAYDLALQNLKDAQITAPMAGVVTAVNSKVGENVTGAEVAVAMISPGLKVKANVSETDITKVKVDDTVSMTLDAFSADTVFQGKILSIDPAETVVQGVIYYSISTLFDIQDPQIKPGMTANLDILAAVKDNVLSISPQSLQYKDKKPYVRVLKDNQPEDRIIQLGLQGNDLVEVTGSLAEGEEIILTEKVVK